MAENKENMTIIMKRGRRRRKEEEKEDFVRDSNVERTNKNKQNGQEQEQEKKRVKSATERSSLLRRIHPGVVFFGLPSCRPRDNLRGNELWGIGLCRRLRGPPAASVFLPVGFHYKNGERT